MKNLNDHSQIENLNLRWTARGSDHTILHKNLRNNLGDTIVFDIIPVWHNSSKADRHHSTEDTMRAPL